eukprot:12716196-Heterocapsa_arctica.AAC.1
MKVLGWAPPLRGAWPSCGVGPMREPLGSFRPPMIRRRVPLPRLTLDYRLLCVRRRKQQIVITI